MVRHCEQGGTVADCCGRLAESGRDPVKVDRMLWLEPSRVNFEFVEIKLSADLSASGKWLACKNHVDSDEHHPRQQHCIVGYARLIGAFKAAAISPSHPYFASSGKSHSSSCVFSFVGFSGSLAGATAAPSDVVAFGLSASAMTASMHAMHMPLVAWLSGSSLPHSGHMRPLFFSQCLHSSVASGCQLPSPWSCRIYRRVSAS